MKLLQNHSVNQLWPNWLELHRCQLQPDADQMTLYEVICDLDELAGRVVEEYVLLDKSLKSQK